MKQPEHIKATTSFRLDKKSIDTAKRIAKQHGVTRSEFYRRLIANAPMIFQAQPGQPVQQVSK